MVSRSKFQLSGTTFIVIVALFFTVFQNSRFFAKAWQTVQGNSLHEFLFSVSMPVLLFCLLNIIFSLLLLPWIRKPIIVIFLLVGAAINYFMFSFDIVIDGNMVENALATDTREATDLVTLKMVLWITILGILPALLVLKVKFKLIQSFWKVGLYRLGNIVISALVVLLIAAFFYKDYASLFRNHKQLVKILVPSNFVAAVTKVTRDHIDANRPFVEIGLDAKKGPLIVNQPKKTLMILVLGETARAENFSLAGYKRDTNPRLGSRNDIIFFDHVSSCGTATAVSVPCMFSNMTRQNYDAVKAKHQAGVLDILATAGVKLLWRENDGGCKGTCERIPNEEVTTLNLPEFCQDKACQDQILLYQLDKYIDGLDDDSLIVLHQMGSHGPSYYRRYDSANRKFTPTCDTNDIQDCNTETLVNTYDNTIVYTDAMLEDTIKLLEKYQDKFDTVMVYLSDHGESLGEDGLYLHGTPYAFAPSQQTHVPFLTWMSKGFIDNRQVDITCLTNEAKNGQFSHDNLFHSLLGMFDITTTEYQSDLDLFRPCWRK